MQVATSRNRAKPRLSRDAIVAPLLAAHRAYLRGWDPDRPGDSDLVVYRSGVPHWTFNGVARARGRDAADALATARRRLDGLPWLWWVGPDSDPGLADDLVALGGTAVARMPIMAIDLSLVTPAEAPPGVSIAAHHEVADFVTAYAAVSNVAPAAIPATIEREQAFPGDILRFVARADSRIVGTAVAWLHGDVATIYLVGTQPSYRKLGIGTAITAAALAACRDRGLRVGSLTASPMGESVYRRMGFTTVAHFDLITFQPA